MWRLLVVIVSGLLSVGCVTVSKDDATPLGLGVKSGSPIGLGLPAKGGALFTDFNPNTQLGVSYMKSTVDLSSFASLTSTSDIVVDKAVVTADLPLLDFRWFPMAGTFNFMLSGGERRIVIDERLHSTSTSEFVESKTTINSVVAGLGVGNQWRWRHVYFGFDWVNVLVPLSSSAKIETTTNSKDVSDADLEKSNDDLLKLSNDIGKITSLGIITGSLGVSF